MKAALYAIGKNLKGKAGFGICRDMLIIEGDHPLDDGYVYEFDISEEKLVRGKNDEGYALNRRHCL